MVRRKGVTPSGRFLALKPFLYRFFFARDDDVKHSDGIDTCEVVGKCLAAGHSTDEPQKVFLIQHSDNRCNVHKRLAFVTELW